METDIDPAEAGHDEIRLLVGDVVECKFLKLMLQISCL